jgi:LuxR family transcriptional regulator, activator of conjugal transfer of Ti plasmids
MPQRKTAICSDGVKNELEVHISFLTQMHENPFSAASDIESACEVLHQIADQYGFPYFSYLQLNGHGTGDRIVANYPQEWRQRYETKLYIHYDPVVTVARQARLPFFWNNGGFIQPYRKAQQKVFHEAGSYGINTGYSIPIAGRSGECGLFSVAAHQERLLLDALGPSGHLVYLLGLQLHDHLLGLTTRSTPVLREDTLTARELECLKWAAEGLTTDQIADRVMISAATVNYHFNKVVTKLDAANRHHAAIKAVRMGLI